MIKPHGRESIPKVLFGFGRHLVYAEGTKTEPLYVENLREVVSEELNVDKRLVDIVPVKMSKTKHTTELVDFAIKNVSQRREKGETIDYVWIFYDKDSFDDFDDAYKKIMDLNTKDSGKNGTVPYDAYGTSWNACWSNECFEVWVYHYFEDLSTALPRDEYIKKIDEFIKRSNPKECYTKNKHNLHSFLESCGGSMEKAIKLMKRKDTVKCIKPNPSSGVYKFAEYINAYLKQGI